MPTGTLPEKFLWSVDALDKYVQNINSPESPSKIDVFLNTVFEESDKAVEEFNSILYENARKSAKLVKRLPLSKKKRVNRKAWFSDSCKDLYNTVINKFPQNADNRKIFYSFRSKFRRLCKLEENKLNRYSDNKHQSEENLPLEEFVRFYKNLNKADNEMDNVQENA